MDDLYTNWLKIPAGPRPPDHYALLNLPRFTSDPAKIEAAAQRQLDLLDRYAIHPDPTKRDLCTRMMNEVAQARVALTSPAKRAAYDRALDPTRRVEEEPEPARAVAAAAPNPFVEKLLGIWKKAQADPVAWLIPIGSVVVIGGAILFAVHIVQSPATKTVTVADQKAPLPGNFNTPAQIAPVQVSSPATPTPSPAPVTPASSGHGLFDMGTASSPTQTVKPPAPVTPAPVEPKTPEVTPPVPKPNPAPITPPKIVQTPPATPALSPPPDAAAQEKAEKLVREIYQDDITAAKTPQEKSALARKMIQLSADVNDDPAGRYVLQLQARDLAVHAGDSAAAIAAVDATARDFQIDALRVKAATLQAVAGFLPDAADHQELIARTNEVIDQAVAADRYDVALYAAQGAASEAKIVKDNSWLEQAQAKLKEVDANKLAFEKVKQAAVTLEANPADPAANTLLGKFRCFYRGDWLNGLPLLARCSDDALKALAEAELSHPADPEKAIDIANGWWDLRDKVSPPERSRIMSHAAALYSGLLSRVEGLSKLVAQKRIEEAEQAGGHSINLLPLIDPSRDAVRGHWTMQPDGLLASSGANRELRIRYNPPNEYDYRVEFSLPYDRSSAVLYLTHDGHVFSFEMGLLHFTRYSSLYGFNCVDRRIPNATSVNGPPLEGEHSYSAIVKVRKNSVSAYLDGNLLVEYQTDYSNLNLMADVDHPAGHPGEGLGVGGGTFQATGPMLFTKIEVIDVTGGS